MGTWTTLEHTADLALEAHGQTPADCLETLCLGLMAQITDVAAVAPREEQVIEVTGMDAPETLVTLLGEILYRVNAQGRLFSRFRALEAGPERIRLSAWGEPRDPDRHAFETEIKAATYHELRFAPDESGPGWRLRVVFDV